MNLKVLVVVIENVDRFNIFLKLEIDYLILKKIRKFDNLFYLVVLEF